MLWLIGRPTVHIGASMMIYGEFAFLFLSGIIRKNPTLARVTLVVGLYYGSLVWYLFPVDAKISWEGHLSGFVVGLIAAVLFRNQGAPRKVYRYEVEPELSDENPYWLENGKMGKWGNGEMGKWGNGEMGKWENEKMGKWENEKTGTSTGLGTGESQSNSPRDESQVDRSIVYHYTPKKKDQQ